MICSMTVCLDGSKYSTVAAQYGVYLAKRMEAQLEGVHVVDNRLLDGPLMADISGWVGASQYGNEVHETRHFLEEKGNSVLNGFQKMAQAEGLRAETSLLNGSPSHTILHEKSHTELIIFGQRGEGSEQTRGMLGNCAERLMRHADKPCLLTPREFNPVKSILMAYDGSEAAGNALREVIELARTMEIPLTVVTVCRDGDTELGQRVLAGAKKLLEAHKFSAEVVLQSGKPEDVIIETAREKESGLIGMGLSQHSWLSERLLGSLRIRLIQNMELPIIMVR